MNIQTNRLLRDHLSYPLTTHARVRITPASRIFAVWSRRQLRNTIHHKQFCGQIHKATETTGDCV